jgi:pimeloyl-ACP methyl ester carboxylesterase
LFVLLHGSLLGPWSWDGVARDLRDRGHEVVAPALPFADARAHTADHVGAIAAQLAGYDTAAPTFVAHSFASLLTPGLGERFPQATMIHLAGLLPIPDRSFVDQLEDEPPIHQPDWIAWGAPPPWADAARARHFLFHDTDEETATRAIARLVADTATVAVDRAPASWPALRSAYVCPIQDRTIDPRWMHRAAHEQLGVAAVDLDAGHCPQITAPQALARLIAELAPSLRPGTPPPAPPAAGPPAGPASPR